MLSTFFRKKTRQQPKNIGARIRVVFHILRQTKGSKNFVITIKNRYQIDLNLPAMVAHILRKLRI